MEGEIGSHVADVRDFPALAQVFAQARPEVVFHLAAQSLVRPSYQDPVATYATNVMGTVHLLEAVRKTPGVRVTVNVTSDKCYENREWARGYREDDAMGGRDPYSSSKGCAELVTAAYRNSFFSKEADSTALASVRAGNVIGGGDWAADRSGAGFRARDATRSTSPDPQSQGYPPVAACAGATVRLSVARRAAVGGRHRVRGGLELRTCRRRRCAGTESDFNTGIAVGRAGELGCRSWSAPA